MEISGTKKYRSLITPGPGTRAGLCNDFDFSYHHLSTPIWTRLWSQSRQDRDRRVYHTRGITEPDVEDVFGHRSGGHFRLLCRRKPWHQPALPADKRGGRGRTQGFTCMCTETMRLLRFGVITVLFHIIPWLNPGIWLRWRRKGTAGLSFWLMFGLSCWRCLSPQHIFLRREFEL